MYAPIPDGEVNILRGVPLDADYKNTLYFASASAQSSYFASKAKYTYSSMMYIRETGRIRVPIAADSIFDCNYLMYRNAQYVNKWFYAFIKQVYYVNDNCAEIDFEIDVLQTWFFNIDIKPSFIERQHTVTDDIGDNVVTENLDIGEYEILNVTASDRFSTWDIVMLSTFDPATWQSSGGGLSGGVYTALNRTVIGAVSISLTGQTPTASFTTDPRTFIADLINNHSDKIDGVVSIFMTPHTLEGSQGLPFAVSKPTATTPLLGSYVPRNKKLYTAPFTTLYVTNGDGAGKMYRFEDFAGALTADFKIYTDRAPNQSVIAVPVAYKTPTYSQSDNNALNFSESLVMSGFPECAWTSDIYKAYVAQNKASLTLSTIVASSQAIAGTVTAVASGGVGAVAGAAGVISGIAKVGSIVTDLLDKARLAPQVHGSPTGTSFFTVGDKTFRGYTLSPKAEYVQILDNYFDMFGYAIHRVQTPNLSARPHWTYIKTANVCILAKTDGLPASDLAKICSIFDNGITYWRNASEVGNYALDNSPS